MATFGRPTSGENGLAKLYATGHGQESGVERKSGAGDCVCANEEPSVSELPISWGIIGVCLSASYCFVARPGVSKK